MILLFLGTWQGKVPVAIKQLRDDRMGEDAAGFERAKHEFLKEAKIFQMVNHPNLVQVHFSTFIKSILSSTCNTFRYFKIFLLVFTSFFA